MSATYSQWFEGKKKTREWEGMRDRKNVVKCLKLENLGK